MAPDQIVFLNGSFLPLGEAHLSPLDRGFIYGDGVYEVIPVHRRAPYRLPQHLARLGRSLDGVGIARPYADAEWARLITELIARQPLEDQAVYLQVTRGVARRDHAFPTGVTPTVFMMSNRLPRPTPEQIDNGVAVVTAVDNRWLRCDMKTTSLLGNVLMRQLAVEHDAAETVMFRDGWLTEASASNVLVVIDGVIVAPPKTNQILPGITLDAVLDVAAAGGLPTEIRPVRESEVWSADEVWISSSTRDVVAVTRIDGKPVGSGQPGPVFRRVLGLIEADIARTVADHFANHAATVAP